MLRERGELGERRQERLRAKRRGRQQELVEERASFSSRNVQLVGELLHARASSRLRFLGERDVASEREHELLERLPVPAALLGLWIERDDAQGRVEVDLDAKWIRGRCGPYVEQA